MIAPPSWIIPENVVERLLPPTARLFAPRAITPPPSIDPAVVPPDVSGEMSRILIHDDPRGPSVGVVLHQDGSTVAVRCDGGAVRRAVVGEGEEGATAVYD